MSAAKIKKLQKGSAETLLVAEFANEHVMIPLGALRNMAIVPTGMGELVMNGEKAFLKLSSVTNVILIVDGGAYENCELVGKLGSPVPL